MTRYIFVYQTKNLVNGKTYIGVHSTKSVDDGYIGCGVFKESDARRLNLPFHRAVNKYGYASFERHILSFYETYDEALEEERYLVGKSWVMSDENYNVALGGRGGSLYTFSDEKKKGIYDKIAYKNRGRKRSKDFCDRISFMRKGKPLSESHKKSLSDNHPKYWLGQKRDSSVSDAISKARKGILLSSEHKLKLAASKIGNKNGAKAIIQYSVNNEYINEYSSLTEAAKSINVCRSALSNHLLKGCGVTGGYKFKYKKDVEQ